MPKVIHTSLREARSTDKDDSISSLWIWNSGHHADAVMTSDDDDAKWYNDSQGVLSKSPSNRSRLSIDSSKSILSGTPSSHSSGSRKLSLSLDSQKFLSLSASPSPMPTKVGVSLAPEMIKPSLLVSPTAKKRNIDISEAVRKLPPSSKDTMFKTSSGYSSDDYGSVGELSLQEDTDGKWNPKKPPSAPSSEEEEDQTERDDSFSNSPAISLSKHIKRIGTSPHSSTTSSLLQASDPDMQPRVVEVDGDDDMDSYSSESSSEEDIMDTEHQREAADEDIKGTAHQREEDEDMKDTDHQRGTSEEVPASEAAMRQKKIETELNGMIDEMMQSDEFYEEDEMEPESYLALMRAAKEICYTRKYYDVSADKIVYFPSITKTIVNNDLFEKAQENYFDEGDEFPSDYARGLRAIAFDEMVADEKAGGEDNELDDDTMHRLSIRVQRAETEFDELKDLIAAAEEEDAQEAKEERDSKVAEADKQQPDATKEGHAADNPMEPTKADSQDNERWWEATQDTEQKYKQLGRKSVIINKLPQVSEQDHARKVKRTSGLWWGLNPNSESKLQMDVS